MQLNIHSFNSANSESWLIILIYAVFWGYSYYSLIMLLIHLRQENKPIEEEKQALEITS